MTRFQITLFIFRRDLRLYDNIGLNAALRLSRVVIPCFIFDPRQINSHPYQSQPGLQFMLECLDDLAEQCRTSSAKLLFEHGLPIDVILKLHQQQQIEAVFVNRDYTPFSRQRDFEIATLCQKLNIEFHSYDDALLTTPEQIHKSDGSAYQVFTPFYRIAKQIPVAVPCELPSYNLANLGTDSIAIADLKPETPNLETRLIGGRKQVTLLLNNLQPYTNYQLERDIPALDATSKLSAYLKFGVCSIREAYYAVLQQLGENHALLRQFYWRDFFTHIAFHFPHVFTQTFYKAYHSLHWDNNIDLFNCWRNGVTGFPIVDAGIRELNYTGFMHNRVRMIAASFLIKDLHISWRWGERYFAQRLIDYDPCVNNGNWQWVASTGCDAQPYFRIFNPWLQQKKFDPECRYIYSWIPELRNIPIKNIHNWDKSTIDCGYPHPIINHSLESTVSKNRFHACLNHSRP